jgi:hypothetical protein
VSETSSMVRCAVVCLLLLLCITASVAQSDPQALTLASQSITALTGGLAVTDITISGAVTRTAGSDVQTGTGTLYGKGQNESRSNLALTAGQRTEIRNYTSSPMGEWIAPNGALSLFAQFNCLTDAVWFFPALSSLAFANDPNQKLSYIGPDTFNGVSVQHLRSVWFAQQLSQMDFYIDSATLVPIAVASNVHADNDSSISIPVLIQFSNYQNVNGALVPFRIQQSLNGSLLLDIAVDTATFNSGLTDDLFSIQ